MKKCLLSLVPIMLVAGCGNEVPSEPHKPQAGKWKVSMGTKSFEIPGATPEQAQTAAKGANVGKVQSSEQCMSQAEADKGAEGIAMAFKQGSCTDEKFSAKDGKIDGTMQCRIPFFDGKAPVTLTGTVSNQEFQLEMASELKTDEFPEGKASMIMEIKGKRVGDC